VELALVLPILLVLVFGIVDFGLALNAQISLTQAAREGARVRALGGTQVETDSRIATAVADITDDYPVTPDAGAACPNSSDVATVTASQDYHFYTPIGALVGLAAGPITLTGKAVMRCLG
jgi:Flp pilus assembly protein TadG